MNYIDILIIIFIAFGALLGFKRGFTRELLSLIGIFVVLILSFILKNPVSVFLYNNLPFFTFGGIFKDITVLNILVYEVLAFFIVFFVLSILLKILFMVTKIFEKILNLTIILGIFSKILGALVGIIKHVIYVFIILFILKLPTIDVKEVDSSKVGNWILGNIPILSDACNKTISVFNEILELKEEYKTTNNVDEFNQKALNSMIEKGVITKENVQTLIDKGKIKNVTIK